MVLFPVTEVEVDGVGMGILSDGTPYLTLRGLASLCGVNHMAILRLANEWDEEQHKPRGMKIKDLLRGQRHPGDRLNVQTSTKGVETHVYTDAVCMAILEYYAFEAAQASSATALRNYRLLARRSIRAYIYDICGYDPDRHIPASWRNFHQRILLNDQLPVGYFCVFREMADIIVHMIKCGCPLDEHTVPDVSVGQRWAKHWSAEGFDGAYGERSKYPHVYPESFPQSAVTPLVWIYPTSALGAFHNWLYLTYIPEHFPKYVQTKVKAGTFLPVRGEQLIEALSQRHLPASPAALPPPVASTT